MAGDREEILELWIVTESSALGRPLKEGVDYYVERYADRMLVHYVGVEQAEAETFEITDTPVVN